MSDWNFSLRKIFSVRKKFSVWKKILTERNFLSEWKFLLEKIFTLLPSLVPVGKFSSTELALLLSIRDSSYFGISVWHLPKNEVEGYLKGHSVLLLSLKKSENPVVSQKIFGHKKQVRRNKNIFCTFDQIRKDTERD